MNNNVDENIKKENDKVTNIDSEVIKDEVALNPAEDSKTSHVVDPIEANNTAPRPNSMAGEIIPEPLSKEDNINPASLDSEKAASEQRELPSEVLANLKRDRDNYKKSLIVPELTQSSSVVPEKKNTSPLISKIKEILQKESNIVKILLAIPAILAGIFLLFVLMYIFNLDTAFFKITLRGNVKDALTQQPVSYAKLSINGEEKATSDDLGNYQITNLNPQVSEVKIEADGYDTLTKQIAINRGFLAYTIKEDFVLSSSAKASVTGKLLANNSTYTFADDKIIANDKEYKIKVDGTFEILDAKTGNLNFQFNSLSFKDFQKTYIIKPGANKLQDIVLTPAGDITGELKSYVSEDLVLGAQFNIENVPASQVNISDDGKFIIKDLDVDTKYKIKVIAQGYKTRDYEINIVQGENKIFNFRLVEDFSIAFKRKASNRASELYTSDLDGVNSEQLTFFDNFNDVSLYLNNAENALYFLSSYENTRGLNSSVRLAYSIDTTNNKQTTLTTNNISSLANVSVNFRAKKLINIVDSFGGFGTNNQKLEMYDLSGDNKKDIKSVSSGKFNYTFVSDSGNYVFFTENDDANAGYYRVDVNTNDSKTISQVTDLQPYDATNDGGKTIFARKNSATGFNDLALYTFQNNETRILDENLDGLDYQFIKGSDDEILYFANRAGKYNIYKFTISQNKDEKVTNLGADDKILDIYQSGPDGRFLFYYTNKGLYVLDIKKPKNFKLVTSDIVLPS